MHKSLAKTSPRFYVKQPLHCARSDNTSCACKTWFCTRCHGRTFRVFSSFGHSGTVVNLSTRVGGEVRLTCLLAARQVPALQEQGKKNNENGHAFYSSHTVKRGKADGEAISLFSVDQIREQESPWKALTGIANTDRLTRKGSPFKRRLQERKKICMLYGNLQRRALNRYLKEIHRPEELLLALESRLDVVLKRSALFPSIHSARQSILQGGISVNRTKVRSPRYHCTPGDLIEIIQKERGVSCNLQNKVLYKRCTTCPKEEDQVKKGGQSKNHLTQSDKWLDLFAFSELLQLGDRKIGRLYTSISSYVGGSIKTDSSFSKQHSKKGKANNLLKIGSLRDTESSFTPNKANLVENVAKLCLERFQVDTPSTPSKSNAVISNSQEGKMVDQADRANLSPTSLTFQKDLTREHTSANQSFVREHMELERSRAIGSRPLHLEVSYRNLCVVFLYPPQRICVDISIDLSLLV